MRNKNTNDDAAREAGQDITTSYAEELLVKSPGITHPDCSTYHSVNGRTLTLADSEREEFEASAGVVIDSDTLADDDFDRLVEWLKAEGYIEHAENQLISVADGQAVVILRGKHVVWFAAAEAARIVSELPPGVITYAVSTEQPPQYRGFAALNDVCDANMLLSGAEWIPADSELGRQWFEMLMAEITRLLLAPVAVAASDLVTAASALLAAWDSGCEIVGLGGHIETLRAALGKEAK